MESTFAAAQLRTNYVPSNSEIQEIRSFVTELLEERSRLEEKISHFQTTIDDLRDQCNKLDTHIEDRLALMHCGARRLPREIVQEVFSHCLPTDTNAVMSSSEPPLLLGQICSGWREITLSTPHLWATLHVCIPENYSSVPSIRWDQIAGAVKTWLGLSRGLPLSISVAYRMFTAEEDLDIGTSSRMGSLMKMLIQHSRRWERIDFALPLPYLAHDLAPLTEADVPLLTSATLKSARSFPRHSWPMVSFLNTPTLRELSILNFKHTACLWTPPWAQLTALYLENYANDPPNFSEIDALTILKQCPMLIRCRLSVESDPLSPPQQTLHEVTLPFLRSLVLAEYSNTPQSPFVHCLKLPVLNYLGIRSSRWSGPMINPSHPGCLVSAFFARANAIEELDLELQAHPLETWRTCLQYANNVRKLTLISRAFLYDEADHLLSHLTAFPNDNLLCPRLEEITFKDCRGFSDENILLFLQERTNPAYIAGGMTLLKRATFHINREVVTDIMLDVQPLIVAGLKLNLNYTPEPPFIFEETTNETPDNDDDDGYYGYDDDNYSKVKFSLIRGLPTYRMVNTLD